MIQRMFLYFLIAVTFLNCDDGNGPNDIRNTSLNDYTAHYIFEFDNTKLALKKMNDYALNEIAAQKHFVDSLKKTGYTPASTMEEMFEKGSLSLTATDVTLYTPPSEFSFDPVDDKDIVVVYNLGEESFKVENISVGEQYAKGTMSIEEQFIDNTSVLNIDTEVLSLEALYQVLEKTRALGRQEKYNTFKYVVHNHNNISLLEVIYTEKGKHISLNYR